ncbi:Phage protein [Escherichia phage T5_ev219]|uniref:Phage protein n=2 Tax=Tequintavirus TaxID=187218 RepID=A0A653G0L8_9CAUD|nr:Phage protein [Escherichia phage T5_ev219]
MDRALRRHHRQRVKNNRKKYWTVFPHEESPKRLGIITTTPCICSCWMCGNPRKHFKNSKAGMKTSEIRKMEAMIMGISNDEFDGFVGFGEGISSGCFEDERPDL